MALTRGDRQMYAPGPWSFRTRALLRVPGVVPRRASVREVAGERRGCVPLLRGRGAARSGFERGSAVGGGWGSDQRRCPRSRPQDLVSTVRPWLSRSVAVSE